MAQRAVTMKRLNAERVHAAGQYRVENPLLIRIQGWTNVGRARLESRAKLLIESVLNVVTELQIETSGSMIDAIPQPTSIYRSQTLRKIFHICADDIKLSLNPFLDLAREGL